MITGSAGYCSCRAGSAALMYLELQGRLLQGTGSVAWGLRLPRSFGLREAVLLPRDFPVLLSPG